MELLNQVINYSSHIKISNGIILLLQNNKESLVCFQLKTMKFKINVYIVTKYFWKTNNYSFGMLNINIIMIMQNKFLKRLFWQQIQGIKLNMHDLKGIFFLWQEKLNKPIISLLKLSKIVNNNHMLFIEIGWISALKVMKIVLVIN